MPYPMVKYPTVAEFIDRVTNEFGGELLETQSQVVGPRGPARIRYLRRRIGDQVVTSQPLPEDDEERLGPDMFQRLVINLRLPHEEWGLPLGPTVS